MLRAWAESCATRPVDWCSFTLSCECRGGGGGVCRPPAGRADGPARLARQGGPRPRSAWESPRRGTWRALVWHGWRAPRRLSPHRGDHRHGGGYGPGKGSRAAAAPLRVGRLPPLVHCQPSPRGRFPTDVAPVGRATHHARPRGDVSGAYVAWVATHRSRAPASTAPLSVRTYRDVRGSLRLTVYPFSLSSSLRRSWPHVPAPTRAARSFVYTVPVQYGTNKQLHRFSSYAPSRFTRIAVWPPSGAATDRGYPRTRVPAARRVGTVAHVSGVRGRPPCSPLPSICAQSAARAAAQARDSPEPLWRRVGCDCPMGRLPRETYGCQRGPPTDRERGFPDTLVLVGGFPPFRILWPPFFFYFFLERLPARAGARWKKEGACGAGHPPHLPSSSPDPQK